MRSVSGSLLVPLWVDAGRVWPSPCPKHAWIVGGLPFDCAVALAYICGECRMPERGESS